MAHTLALILTYKYLILLPLAAVEGPIVALVAGYLARFDILSIWAAYLVLVVSDLIPDTIFYYVGYHGKNLPKVKRYLRRRSSMVSNEKLKHLWFKHGRKTMLIGKLSVGLGGPILASGGAARVPFGRFLGYALPITAVKFAILFAIGFFAALSIARTGHYVQVAAIVIGVFALLIAGSYIAIQKYSERQLEKLEEEDERESKA